MAGKIDIGDYWERSNRARRPTDYLVEFYGAISKAPPYPDREHVLRAHQRRWMMKQIDRFGWHSLLDAGCGPGFWFQLWNELKLSATAVDRATAAREHCDRMNAAIGSAFTVHTAKLDLLPFETKSFDVVVTIKVLLHTPPEEIEATMSELGRVARYMMLLERNSTGTQVSAHVFEHDLLTIGRGLGFTEMMNRTFEDHQRFIIFASS